MTNEELELFEQAQAQLAEFNELFEDLQQAASMYGVIERTGEDDFGHWFDLNGSRKYLSEAATSKLGFTPALGDTVLVEPKTGMPMRKVERSRAGWTKNTISDVLHEGYLLGTDLVYVSLLEDAELEEGDQVLTEGPFIVGVLPKKEQTQYAVTKATEVSWDDIGGLQEAKKALKDAVELPCLHADIFKAYGKTPSKGVLLHGPPGCGKTMFAKAAATAIAEMHGQANGGFLYIKGPEVLSKWVGQAEAAIRSVFSRARDFEKENGYPAVLFIDEAEAILGRRGKQGNAVSSTLVPQFLAEMDGLESAGCFVLLATNLPDSLDSAVIRDGRIDQKIHIGRPGKEEADSILDLYLTKMLTKDSTKVLKAQALKDIFDEDTSIYTTEEGSFGLPEILNGAMLRNMVENAAGEAMRRDIDKGTDTPSGITKRDIRTAIKEMVQQNRGLEHTEVLTQWIHAQESVTVLSKVA